MLHLSIAARPQGLNALIVVILLLALVHVSSASPHVNYVRQANVTTGGNPSRNKTIYTPLFERPSNSTPRFINVTKQDARPLLIVPLTPALNKRQSTSQEEGTCGPGVPCTNGACCSNTGICGYSPDFCGAGNCISNCDAKAQCGQYAVVGKEKCPLNVCCSQFGFCGTTADFCSKDKDCDESGGTCGDVPAPSCDGNMPGAKSIGYYESWASTRPCDKVEPEDLDLTGFTHLNFAFAFFHPTTFQMTDMDANAGRLYNRFTELKASKPSLKTWISVGGWSFNDETNIPNTRMAFSDMASTAENRAKFISSLVHFMSAYGFDGMDLDWEYPGADDRGGRPEDTANFVLLCKEIKAAFGGYYGFSITLPVSYWYLRHFDIAGMEPYVDWFNVMTYDIHGVWDSENRFTGPYVRPHTNLTEIDEGLSLLWRAGVSAGNVVLGLGWYGRSFKLASSSCTKPGCLFLEGAAPGECSKASGILTSAEIHRIIDDKGLTPSFDEEAAVNWITWDSDQWVSYDDERTFALKIKYAEDKCLGGTMIWAIDQGSSDGSTNDEYSGLDALESSLTNKGLSLDASFPLSNGLKLKGVVKDASKRATAEDTCYTSFCGEPCVPGYTSVSTMNGQVGGLGEATACQEDNVQSLCCPSGTFTGRCEWYGWRGQGLSCSGSCAQGDDMIAKNTNHIYDYPEQNFFEDQTCNGGFQAYCCRGFRPGPNIDDIQLLEPEHFDPMSLDKRSLASCTTYAVIAGGILTFTPFISLALAGAVLVEGLCLTTEAAASSKAAFAGYSLRTSVNGNKRPASSAAQNPKGVKKPRPANGVDAYGRWAKAVYGVFDRTCQVTYTCDYGYNFDQVCDNQRYGLDVVLGGATTVFHYDPAREYGVGGRVKQQWRGQHHAKYRQSHGRPDGGTCANDDYDGSRCRCEVDEFPLDSLGESYQAAQALRLLDGNENGRQGRDWQDFINAEWFPCSFLLKSSPPVTWAIGSPADASDPRLTTNAFIPKYGFDSASGRDQCWATYTSPGGQTSVISDHGFRVQSGPDFPDPMFAQSVGYPRQAYRVDPDGLAANARPTSVASAQWLKKRGDEHEIPMYGDSAVQATRLSRMDVDAMNNPNALKGTTTREAQPRGNSVVATASATAPPQPTDPALDRLKGKHELHQVLRRRHSHGHRRRYVD